MEGIATTLYEKIKHYATEEPENLALLYILLLKLYPDFVINLEPQELSINAVQFYAYIINFASALLFLNPQKNHIIEEFYKTLRDTLEYIQGQVMPTLSLEAFSQQGVPEGVHMNIPNSFAFLTNRIPNIILDIDRQLTQLAAGHFAQQPAAAPIIPQQINNNP